MSNIALRSSIAFSLAARGKIELIRRRHDDVNVSDWVQEQFPEFVQSDYPRMIEFIQAYYKFISSKTENGEIDDIRDIDFTSGDYLLKIRKEFSFNAAKFNFLSEPEFIRHAKEFYASKGSEESIKFLFRVLFNEQVEIEYPSSRLFAASSAHWEQYKSIKVLLKPNSLNPENFIGSYLTLRNSNDIRQIIEVDDVEDITIKQQGESSTTFEIFTQTEIYIDLKIGDVVIGDNFEAEIIPSLTKVIPITAGNNFRIGQVVKLDGAVGSGGVGVISSVSDIGSIKSIKLLKFGKGYTNNFYVKVDPEGVFADSGQTFESSQISTTYKVSIDDSQRDYVERINIFKTDYTYNDSPGTYKFYVSGAYVGQYTSENKYIQTFYEDEQISGLLYCSVGPISKYPGKFINKVGAVSDYSVLQDGKYFQNFSYNIKSKRDINSYREILTTFAHPAGLKMFSEYSVEKQLSVQSSVEVLTTEENDIITSSSTIMVGEQEITYLWLRGNLVNNFTPTSSVLMLDHSLHAAYTNVVNEVTEEGTLGTLKIINNLEYSTTEGNESVKVYAESSLDVTQP